MMHTFQSQYTWGYLLEIQGGVGCILYKEKKVNFSLKVNIFINKCFVLTFKNGTRVFSFLQSYYICPKINYWSLHMCACYVPSPCLLYRWVTKLPTHSNINPRFSLVTDYERLLENCFKISIRHSKMEVRHYRHSDWAKVNFVIKIFNCTS